MPEVQVCFSCAEIIRKESDEFVVVRKADGHNPELLQHLLCRQRDQSAPSVQIGPIRRVRL